MRRDTGAKEDVPWAGLTAHVGAVLADIQKSMLEKARAELTASIATITKWDDFIPALNEKKIVLAPWCDEMVSFGGRGRGRFWGDALIIRRDIDLRMPQILITYTAGRDRHGKIAIRSPWNVGLKRGFENFLIGFLRQLHRRWKTT